MKMNPATITFQVTPEHRRALKALAAQLDQPIRVLLTLQIEELLRRTHPPAPRHDPPEI